MFLFCVIHHLRFGSGTLVLFVPVPGHFLSFTFYMAGLGYIFNSDRIIIIILVVRTKSCLFLLSVKLLIKIYGIKLTGWEQRVHTTLCLDLYSEQILVSCYDL